MTNSEDRALVEPGGKLRLFIEAPLGQGERLEPSTQQAHYLLHVMRARAGDRVHVFNGRQGEWLVEISEATRRSCVLTCIRPLTTQSDVPDLWLVFAPIKKTAADYVAQKATELGVRVLQPVFTRRTIVHRINQDRMRANAIEAAEQSGRLTVPEVRDGIELAKLLPSWPADRRILFCDEGGGSPIAETLAGSAAGAWAILTGPEGGFDPAERDLIRSSPLTVPVSLGTRILRADTAALAALSVWQAIRGDWPHR
jgi:16S rRNA (uracil1498-N3)-methyltransferase